MLSTRLGTVEIVVPKTDHRWQAELELIGQDILLIHNGMPFLSELAQVAKGLSPLFTPSTVVDAGADFSYQSARQRSSHGLSLTDPNLPKDFHRLADLCEALEGCLASEYMARVNQHAKVRGGSGFELLRYDTGQYFGLHVDIIQGHPTFVHRRLAVIAFCNDDYEGGELVFPRQEATLKPRAGSVIVFPAGFTHPHEVKAVTSGSRFTLVTWFF